ncbi:hypothetical protein L207DRAFT_510382 [Hyaloscypha variabilis F]|uniref:Zn(2)-C6 fungal-type domain-containing protein n=1 Tax=Hyaloscypha variabilis (strain UAMH 11265 / GT02V1 / F) TaxID=1149755 RepID=A0A2J6RUF0_HYAVF|nr:hypothetical protein L207DRAFT_510382 [Hyaloscypha variabilis F]
MVPPAEAKRERRTHRKSRLGCQSCKQRKIKCDESRPNCCNCIRREIECVFPARSPKKDVGERAPRSELAPECNSQAATQSQLVSSQFSPIQNENTFYGTLRFVPYREFHGGESKFPNVHCESEAPFDPSTRHSQTRGAQDFQAISERVSCLENTINLLKTTPYEPTSVLTYADMALLHHYFYMPDDSSVKEELLQAGFRYPHLLHLILAFAALHWSRQEPQQKSDLVAQAERHHVIGMQGATKLLSDAEEDSMAIVYKSAILIGLYNLALGPQPGEYVGFSDHDGGASFLVFLRGVRIIGEKNEEATQSPAPATPKTAPLVPKHYVIDMFIPDQLPCANVGHAGYFEDLRCLARASPNDPLGSASRDTSIYLTAIDQLEPFFEEIYGSQTSSSQTKTATPYSRMAFGWLYRVSGEFINRLQEKAPLALAIFACFAVVLKKLETGWVVEGWPEHIMSGVWKFLWPESRGLVWWPMLEMGLELPIGH